MTATTQTLAVPNHSNRMTPPAPSRDLLDRLTLTATDTVDWLDLGPVTVSGSAWWECVRVRDGLPAGSGRARLVTLLWRFFRSREAAAAGVEAFPFRVPAIIRPGVWKNVPLVATRRDEADGTAGWHVSRPQ